MRAGRRIVLDSGLQDKENSRHRSWGHMGLHTTKSVPVSVACVSAPAPFKTSALEPEKATTSSGCWKSNCNASRFPSLPWKPILTGVICCFLNAIAIAQSGDAVGFPPYVTFAGTFDFGYRATQLFEPHHNAFVGQWESRAEVWLHPYKDEFSWGPYFRINGIAATQSEAWENGWIGAPGIGFQVYPFSARRFRKRDSRVGNILGPIRLFAEYNRVDYWGVENQWRPHGQSRFGVEYWRARHVNSMSVPWWTEIWSGAWRQSTNEFSSHYNTGILANSLRAGARVPDAHLLSAFTPYVTIESSLTDNEKFYWENKLLVGGGLRFAPPLKRSVPEIRWLNRFAVYGEFVHVAAYYRQTAPASIPNHDVRVGITFSFGQWYH